MPAQVTFKCVRFLTLCAPVWPVPGVLHHMQCHLGLGFLFHSTYGAHLLFPSFATLMPFKVEFCSVGFATSHTHTHVVSPRRAGCIGGVAAWLLTKTLSRSIDRVAFLYASVRAA